jgi:hypothetical protein
VWYVLLSALSHVLEDVTVVICAQAAITQHVLTASRALIADHSDHEDRAVLLGRNMLAYSIGAMIGPAAAGLLANYSLPVRFRTHMGHATAWRACD